MSRRPDVVLLLAFAMCNIVVATTKLQSNNKNNNDNKKIELCMIEQNMYVNSYFWSCPCVSFIILLLLQQHNSAVTCVSFIILLFLQQYNFTLTTTSTTATTTNFMYMNYSIFNNSYVDWCFYCCCCYCVILLLLLFFICNDRWTTTSDKNKYACVMHC